jgi:hypothetical protein
MPPAQHIADRYRKVTRLPSGRVYQIELNTKAETNKYFMYFHGNA